MGMGLGVWGMKHHMEIPNTNHLILSIGGFVLAGALIAYELWFLGRKGPLSVSDPEGPRTS